MTTVVELPAKPKPTIKEYGLILRQENLYGTEYVSAILTSKNHSDGRDHPYGCATDGEGTGYSGHQGIVPTRMHGLQMDGLQIYGHVSDYDEHSFLMSIVCYRDVYTIELEKAERCVRTLKKVMGQIRKDDAREGGDVLMSLATCLKLSFCCEQKGERGSGYYNKGEWRFMPITQGRDRFRQMIVESREITARKHGKTTCV